MIEINQQEAIKYPRPPVVTRTEWGCPDGQVTTHGSLAYTTVTHLIVHHTATGNAAENGDWAAVVRNIWDFHVFTNKWSDLGYNYLIDPNGLIYEGRSGGDNVRGAHFSGANGGTMGVSILGTFTDVAPTEKALTSLKKILAWKSDQRGLDPTGVSLHAASGLQLKTISGHRDGPSPTECPGDALYPLLPSIRTGVKSLITGIGSLAGVSAASFRQAALANESLVAAFGTELATSTQAAQSTPLPTSLDGTTLNVRDSSNNEKAAQLFFVSPAQINFLMPSGLSHGPATITVTNSAGRLSVGSVELAPVAPALFAANANGHGIASALILRANAGGAQIYQPVATYDQAIKKYVALPIDLGPESDQVFLVAYGTGIRFRSSLSNVSAKLGGQIMEVLYAGPASEFLGLDQINIRLSRNLIGRGDVDFELSVDGLPANLLSLKFR